MARIGTAAPRLIPPTPARYSEGHGTVAAAFIVIVGLFFIGVAVMALVLQGWRGIFGAALMGFFGFANFRVASVMLQPPTDEPEKLS